MRSFAALRLAAQLLLVSAVLCLFGPFRADWPLFALLPALALLAALAALPVKAAPARLALGLLPALALPLASGLPSLIAPFTMHITAIPSRPDMPLHFSCSVLAVLLSWHITIM